MQQYPTNRPSIYLSSHSAPWGSAGDHTVTTPVPFPCWVCEQKGPLVSAPLMVNRCSCGIRRRFRARSGNAAVLGDSALTFSRRVASTEELQKEEGRQEGKIVGRWRRRRPRQARRTGSCWGTAACAAMRRACGVCPTTRPLTPFWPSPAGAASKSSTAPPGRFYRPPHCTVSFGSERFW